MSGTTSTKQLSGGSEKLRGKYDFLISGFSLILITSYAPFTIAVLLAPRFSTVPLGFFVAAIFFSMGVGTLLSASLTRTGLIVAPAVGMSSFVAKTSGDTITTQQFLWATIVAALVAIFLSLPRRSNDDPSQAVPSYRKAFLEGIPMPIKVGVRGGIGALLASTALEALRSLHDDAAYEHLYLPVTRMFVVAVIVLLGAQIAQRRLELAQTRSTRQNGLFEILLLATRSASFVVSVALLIILYHLGAFPLPHWQLMIQHPASLPLFQPDSSTSVVAHTSFIKDSLTVLCFSAIILFVFITDIPGSPYDILRSPALGNADPDIERRIEKSFLVTSIVSIFNPIIGLFTSVYYAENHIIIGEDESQITVDDVKAAWFCSIVFLCVAAAFLFLDLPVEQMRTWLWVAVAPSLFCLGIRLTARALQRDAAEDRQDHAGGQDNPRSKLIYFVPISLTILLTDIVHFELALPLGIFYYATLSYFTGFPDEKPAAEGGASSPRFDGYFRMLWIISFLISLYLGIPRLGIT